MHANKQARDAFKNSDYERKPKVGGITRADKPIVPWYRPAEASQQYVDAIGPCVTPSNRNFTVVVLYDYEPAWEQMLRSIFSSAALKTNAPLCSTRVTALYVVHSTV